MKKIIICDSTIRLNPTLSFKDKLILARELDRAGVDVIELSAIADEKADAILTRSVAAIVNNACLSIPVGMSKESASIAYEAVKSASKLRLHVSLPVSPAKMEYDCALKPDKLLALIRELVSFCVSLCGNVEFSALDATRAEAEFLAKAVGEAVAAGAQIVSLCDTAGVMLPDEYAAFIGKYSEAVTVGADCTDELGMGAASTIAAVKAGAGQLKTAVGKSRPNLGTMAEIFRTLGDKTGISCALDLTVINRSVCNIEKLMSSQNQGAFSFAASPLSAGLNADAQTMSLEEGADIAAVSAAVRMLGYTLNAEDLGRVYEEVQRITKSKRVGARELDAIVAGNAMQVPGVYKLQSYVINSGNVIRSTANIQLLKDGEEKSGLAIGDGPIDASFLAIEQIVGYHYELDDFQIQSVTEGREAMGSALVKLRYRGALYSGEGLSTDILGASIRAYLSALNKIVYEQNGGAQI